MAKTKAAAGKTDTEMVAAWMQALKHPLKAEIEALRKIITGADKRIAERIKWNAPSYYATEDLATFNHRMTDRVHLIFHHTQIDSVTSPLFEGDYKGRRMVYFKSLAEIKAGKKEIERILRLLLDMPAPVKKAAKPAAKKTSKKST
jgi:hypothetical protein